MKRDGSWQRCNRCARTFCSTAGRQGPARGRIPGDRQRHLPPQLVRALFVNTSLCPGKVHLGPLIPAIGRFGWRFNDRLTVDENFMDLAALAARNSLCTGGHMGCVLVKDGDIMAISTNTPLFQPYASDVHAEVNAVSGCARHGLATAGSTAYITMPPCKHCFMVLQAAGIQRIVSRHGTLLETCTQAAAEIGIEWGIVKDDAQSDSRRAAYVQAAQQADPEYHAAVAAHRLARKQAKKDAYAARERRKVSEQKHICPA